MANSAPLPPNNAYQLKLFNHFKPDTTWYLFSSWDMEKTSALIQIQSPLQEHKKIPKALFK